MVGGYNITIEEITLPDESKYDSFSIIESEKDISDCLVSPDIAVCDKCKSKVLDNKNRRYLHPFTNCTQCGPRLTILRRIPYDRINTSMSSFQMCPSCTNEYFDHTSRRYDAQPNCCNHCGLRLYIIGTDLYGEDAIIVIRKAIMSGEIVGIKGIGGFHLCCDAKNPNAVSLLRKIKQRPSKPFAIMMKNEKVVEKECFINSEQHKLLNGWQKPIILLKKRHNTSLCDDIAPRNSTIGVMLPYTPLHLLLFDYPDNINMTDSLIMTSGNSHGAPICHNDNEAIQEIDKYCTLILSNDREIVIRADDSVCDWFDEKPYMIRRSRGFAPLPITISHKSHPQILAIGGELKSTFCIAKIGLLYPSPYVGDMTDFRTISAFRDSVMHMIKLLETNPEIVICDLHPNYNSVMVANEIARDLRIPVAQVQTYSEIQ